MVVGVDRVLPRSCEWGVGVRNVVTDENLGIEEMLM